MNRQHPKFRSNQGFTLIELMIAVSIVGILSAIAYPTYSSHVQKSKRTEAMTVLMQAAQQQEKYFSENLKYAYNASTLGLDTSTDNYTISLDAYVTGGGNCDNATKVCTSFKLTAAAKTTGTQANDSKCKKFILESTGSKSSKDSDDNDSSGCWQ